MKRLILSKPLILATLLLVLIVAFSYLRHQNLIAPERIFAFLSAHPTLAPVLFILTYIVMSVALVPTLPLNLGAGFFWEPIWATCFSVIGATAGAAIAFLISRYLAGNYFNNKFQNQAWLWLQNEIKNSGWKAVAFTRVNPIFSFGLLNYFFGVTSIQFTTYIWATAIFLIPPSALVAIIGRSVGDFTLNGSASKLMQNVLLLSAAITLIIAVKLLLKKQAQKNPKKLETRS